MLSSTEHLNYELATSLVKTIRTFALLPRAALTPKLLYSLKPYLHLLHADRRRAVARLLAGTLPYAIDSLRRHDVLREWRLCRLCRRVGIVEDEEHMLFCCPDPVLETARTALHNDILVLKPDWIHARRRMGNWEYFGRALMDKATVHLVADFVSVSFQRCADVPVLHITSEEQLQALAGQVLSL
ncbi:hypothetical protein C8Q73DRAFT_787909 [Cubamyces lactineus]|nr:hypothetical protein C8Q73DRAFT_787909 [Cubamyces lactineus]